jgi:hypothetical protein
VRPGENFGVLVAADEPERATALLADAGRILVFLDQSSVQVRHVIDTNVTGNLSLSEVAAEFAVHAGRAPARN